jgi:hypothetical protein
MVSLLALTALAMMLVMLDDRVRDAGVRLLDREPAAAVAQAGAHVSSTSSGFIITLREQALDHGAMTAFVIVAAVLVVFMLRT